MSRFFLYCILIPGAAGFISASFGISCIKQPLIYALINFPICIMSCTIYGLRQEKDNLINLLKLLKNKE